MTDWNYFILQFPYLLTAEEKKSNPANIYMYIMENLDE